MKKIFLLVICLCASSLAFAGLEGPFNSLRECDFTRAKRDMNPAFGRSDSCKKNPDDDKWYFMQYPR